MAGNHLAIRVLSNSLTGQLQGQLRQRASQVVRKTAADIQADWAADVRVDTGEYKSSIQVEMQPGDLTATVGSNVAHGAPNEYGGPTIAARPSARQAAERHRRPFEQAMRHVSEGR